MQQWGYKIVRIGIAPIDMLSMGQPTYLQYDRDYKKSRSASESLDQLDARGWELVSVDAWDNDTATAVFKRPKQDQDNAP